jgi:hypothetical protein
MNYELGMSFWKGRERGPYPRDIDNADEEGDDDNAEFKPFLCVFSPTKPCLELIRDSRDDTLESTHLQREKRGVKWSNYMLRLPHNC